MPGVDVWPVVHNERTALADDLTSLGEDQWGTPSLCSQWTVQDVVAHMTAAAKITPASFFPKLVGSGFSLSRMQSKDIAAERGGSGSEALSRFEAVIASEKRPPGPKETMLGETIIHSEDIRRALGVQHEYPGDAVAGQVVEGAGAPGHGQNERESIGPDTAGPDPCDQFVSVARKERPAMRRLVPSMRFEPW